jgi:uncharacterized membrane protein YkvA (DUF1232 family)
LKLTLRQVNAWARGVKRDVLAVYLVARDPRVPWPVKILAAAVAAYALSPIDLIPDFIPVLGYLDDLVIVPLGILAVVKLIPADVLAELREEAVRRLAARPRSWAGAAVILALWFLLLAVAIRWLASIRPPSS